MTEIAYKIHVTHTHTHLRKNLLTQPVTPNSTHYSILFSKKKDIPFRARKPHGLMEIQWKPDFYSATMFGRGQCTLETVHERKGNRRKWYRQTDRQTGGHRVTVRIPSKKRGRITQHARRNRFRTLSLFDISIFFLSGRLARRVPRKMGVRIPHARGTRVCVQQKACASLTTPFFAFSSQVFPFWRIPMCTEREKRKK